MTKKGILKFFKKFFLEFFTYLNLIPAVILALQLQGKMLYANQIAEFSNQLNLKKKINYFGMQV